MGRYYPMHRFLVDPPLGGCRPNPAQMPPSAMPEVLRRHGAPHGYPRAISAPADGRGRERHENEHRPRASRSQPQHVGAPFLPGPPRVPRRG